jgi:hypothetical protein
MSSQSRVFRSRNVLRAGTRSRLLGWLIAINLVLFSSPLLPGWLAEASTESGTRLVKLCTEKGIRVVAVPVDAALPAPQTGDDEHTGRHCATCPLGKCSGSGFAPAFVSRIESTTADIDSRVIVAERLLTTNRVILGPPTRAPPALA